MAISSPFYRAPQRSDWQSSMERARGPLYRDADPGMVVEPLDDPGNVTPSTQYPTQPQQNAQEMQDIWRVGGQNALMQPSMFQPVAMQDHDVNRRLDTGFLPHYGYIPTEPPPGTYTGDIPTPPSDYGPTGLSLPHDWQRMNKLMQPGDPASWQLLLKTMLVNRHNRRA